MSLTKAQLFDNQIVSLVNQIKTIANSLKQIVINSSEYRLVLDVIQPGQRGQHYDIALNEQIALAELTALHMVLQSISSGELAA